MPWYLILAAGFILGFLATRAAIVLCEYLPSRPVARALTVDHQEAARTLTQEPRRYGAGDILGYRDRGGRYIAPTWPGARHARNSAAALAAWDARQEKAT